MLLGSFDVVEVEKVWVQYDFCAVVEEDAVRAVGKHVAESVFRAEIHEFDHELSTHLAFLALYQLVYVNG